MAVMFARQERSEADLFIQEGGWTGLSKDCYGHKFSSYYLAVRRKGAVKWTGSN